MARTKRKRERAPDLAYGEGSYSQRADGSWTFAIMVGKDASGKPRRRYLRARSLDALKQRVADTKARGGGQIVARTDESRPDRTASPGLRAFVESWLADVVQPKAQASGATTFETYATMWKKHARPVVDDCKLADFKGRDVARLYADLRGAGATPSVIEKTATMLSAAFTYATKVGEYPGVNPFRLVPRPTYESRERRAFSAEEARRFLAAARGDRFELLWVLLMSTGMRLGEALALRWSDVDLRSRTVAIRQAAKEGSGAVRIGATKTRGKRQVKLPAIAIDAFKRNRSRGATSDKEFMFLTETGGHPRRSNLRQRHFQPICKKAALIAEGDVGMPTIHSLRHTAATLALIAGAPAKSVASRLGHGSTRMLQKHYEHLMPGADDALADLIDVALAKRGGSGRARAAK